jgi:hypothetical protein
VADIRRLAPPAVALAVGVALVSGLGALVAARAAAPPAQAPIVNTAAGRAKGLPFGPGESLRFSIEYGLVKAGSAWLEVEPMMTYRDRSCYHLVSRAESNEFMSKIYKVRDRIDSLVDAEGLYTMRYRKRIREGNYERDYDIAYDPAGGKARYADGMAFEMRPWSKDALAAFYYVRHQPLEVGKDIVIAHHSDRRSTDILVKVHRKERVKVPAGEFDCVVIEPVMESEGLFKASGRLQIWVTDDARRIPVLMKSKIPVGTIDAVLQEMKLGGPASAVTAGSTTAGS